jgi:pimeloyl-ACP methyl ester carboxylesterase
MAKAMVNGIQIEYETFGNVSSPSVLLIMGLAGQLIHWQTKFCLALANHGYHVIRYDNRDSGLSTKFNALGLTKAMEKINALFMGETVPVPYGIEDMAKDAKGLLDFLDIHQAHICGMSMGGFIAQTFAINNPDRTLSLTSIYSSPGNKKEFSPTQEVMEFMLTPTPEQRAAYIEYTMKYFKLISGKGLPSDEDFHQSLAAQSYDRSFCPEGIARQYLAIMTQKDRVSDLENLSIPTLVIHGDDDPVIPLAGGQATVDAIPDAKIKIIKGMGHALPNLQTFWSDILDAMVKQMES